MQFTVKTLILASILKCDFEYAEIDSKCDWNSYDSNKNVWKKEKGTSTVYFNGPSYDHSTASGKQIILLCIFCHFS